MIAEFLVLAAVLAVALHAVDKNYARAVVVTGAAASVIFQAFVRLELGRPDKLELVALLFGAMYAGAVSAAIGAVFLLLRARKRR
jgi:formate-dependent nitrite reductase membrane component NrfD